MKNDAIILKPKDFLAVPEIPKDWDYDKSVKLVGGLIYKWKNMTAEIAEELCIARKSLSREGRPKTGKNFPVCPNKRTWASYCQDIGIEKRTANMWLFSFYGLARLPSPLLPKLESQVLYADPPWAFSNSGLDQSAAQQYPTMSVEEICDYKDTSGKSIRQLANEKQSVLFLWVPAALLPEGLKVVNAWRFQYKTQLVWKKDKAPGMGWWVNSKHELLFIASKGEELHPAIKYDSVFEAPVTKHSRKPEQVYEMIESMYSGPYIELFARQTRKGWGSWGNELKPLNSN
jgi:N6-adenosine-specific RNA methylase IME4